MRDVLAKKRHYDSEVEDAFREEFPTIHSTIRAINRHDHAELIRVLQRVESRVVVEMIGARLVARGRRFVTVHDCVYAAREEIPEVASVFREVISLIGGTASLKTET